MSVALLIRINPLFQKQMKKIVLILMTAALFAFPFAMAADDMPNISGIFTTDFGDLAFNFTRTGYVTGNYTYANGKVEGKMEGHTLTGRWTQSNGKGRFVFVFNEDYTEFKGKWSYNDAEPSSQWNGKLKPGTRTDLDWDWANKKKNTGKDLSGVFSTGFGDMTFDVSGSTVTGSYTHASGRIEGTLNGHTLTGRWTQSNSKGRFVFVFNDDFTAFTGKWSYNDAEPSSQWNGKLKSGTRTPSSATSSTTPTTTSTSRKSTSIPGVFSTGFGDMTFNVSGSTVTGSYTHASGRIEGTLNGHTLTGRWTQSNGKGRFVFVFNDDFTAFTGKWSYNDAEPSSQWNGQRK